MSDTNALIKYVRDRLNDGPNLTFGKPTVRDLVDALEQAETRVHELEDYLSSAISKQSEMADGIERVVKANHPLEAKAQEAEARAERAEAESARLTKERDWLAAKLSDCPPVFTNCAVDCAECRKEAARRAVADAESPENMNKENFQKLYLCDWDEALRREDAARDPEERRAVAAGEG